MPGTITLRPDFHALCRRSTAGRREDSLAGNLDHAGTAIAVGTIAFLITKVGDLDPVSRRALQNRLTGSRIELASVDMELDVLHRSAGLDSYAHLIGPKS